jgi:two-component system, NarL family, nitrate/nitrite response regulator NarL
VPSRRGQQTPLRVVIADDHRLFAEALEAILTTDERIEVVGQASDGAQAVELARKLDPDVVLMDVSMPVLDGFEATREIREESAEVRVLMLTGSNSRDDVDRSREAGAVGYVTKDRIASELVATIVEVTRR